MPDYTLVLIRLKFKKCEIDHKIIFFKHLFKFYLTITKCLSPTRVGTCSSITFSTVNLGSN